MYNNCIKNLLNLKDVKVKNLINHNDFISVDVELPVSKQICPKCNNETSYIKDYYNQPVKDIPIYFKPTILNLRKPRYKCKCCGITFYPQNEIVNKYARKTSRLVGYVVNELRNLIAASDISKKTTISPNFISKLLPYLAVTTSSLPKVLCIDEFKGNSGKFKYQVALINGETHEVVDILECRHKHFLCEYFKKFPQEQLDNVKFLVTDLWESYKDIGMTYFKHAKIVADRFHWIRYACNTVDSIRKEVQKNLPKLERKYFKHSRGLLLSRHCNINPKNYDELEYMLINYSEDLRIAYREKEELLDIIHSDENSKIKILKFDNWIKYNLESSIPQLRDCAKTYQHWYTEIKNSLEFPYSNGPTEGFNCKIKTLKRVTFGMHNFKNFKARILLLNRP